MRRSPSSLTPFEIETLAQQKRRGSNPASVSPYVAVQRGRLYADTFRYRSDEHRALSTRVRILCGHQQDVGLAQH
jgi:hypothetical protein